MPGVGSTVRFFLKRHFPNESLTSCRNACRISGSNRMKNTGSISNSSYPKAPATVAASIAYGGGCSVRSRKVVTVTGIQMSNWADSRAITRRVFLLKTTTRR